ncbi:(d)CMP kinase [Spiractinospora alimapuensis]|uniref:(d)CMP kinase n=1 Tax=Spiractinospora alimapuensis TaxID=2820884 RepID=UPI001EEBFE34|nr:(d)CMP kinase [Spiractinospora alimapuensis]QVQ53060.1 (d)CMP kinase [Spiractinospora alimapuensis]
MGEHHRDGGLVIAIDGPSGSGKSSTSRGVANARGLRYLDTGAMYRAMTWWMLRHDVDTGDPVAVAKHVPEPVITVGTDPSAPSIEVDGVDVSTEIRGEEVTGHVSAVSAVPEIRARMLADQRAIITLAGRETGGIVVEGRDITTVVAPDAPVKVFLTASQEARANRRSAEVEGSDVSATLESLTRRDTLDSSRATSPLRQTKDAVELDTTGLTLPEVIDHIVRLAEQAEQSSPTG